MLQLLDVVSSYLCMLTQGFEVNLLKCHITHVEQHFDIIFTIFSSEYFQVFISSLAAY